MSNKPTILSTEQLRAEITRRAPWYQCIHFPEHGISTTDEKSNAMLDAAWDNKTDDITLEEAACLRPLPKWKLIREFLPPIRDLDVLEIGSNCGFFSFEFIREGARFVTGLDVAPKWLDNARWAQNVLGLNDRVKFVNCDFMRYPNARAGLLDHTDDHISLPNNLHDFVFMSTVLDHLFFPLVSIYKMCKISRKYVIIDIPVNPADSSVATLRVADDNSHHGFTFTPEFIRTYLLRLGLRSENIQCNIYNNNRNMCFVIKTEGMSQSLVGA
jgi:SAM-dependent methyltransferase